MKRPIVIYTAVAYAVTWGIVLTAYAFYRDGDLTLTQLNLLYNAGALGPLVGAWIAAKATYGNAGTKKLFSTFRITGISRRAWLLSLSPLAFLAVGFVTYPIFKGHPFTFAETQRQFHLTDNLSYVAWLLPFFTYSFLEEFGWRGFLLPHLQQKFTALKATLLLTVIWASWHLPFFLWRFQFSGFITIGFFVSIFIGAVVLTTCFNLSNGSIVPVITFHLLNNIASALDKEYLVAVLGTGFTFVAIYAIRTYGGKELSEATRVTNFYQ